MRYDRGDSFPIDFEPNGNPFGSKSKGKLSPQTYPIQLERKWKYSFVSCTTCAYRPSITVRKQKTIPTANLFPAR